MKLPARLRTVIVPAAVFQSVIFGGAYGTGREIAEFVSAYGPLGGILSLLVVAAIFIVTLTLCFELARMFKTYEYRSFLASLVGPGWVVYEILLVLSIPLVLAVNGSAVATIMEDQLRLPATLGVIITFGVVTLISFRGRKAVEGSMLFIAAGLVAVLSMTIAAAMATGADSIRATLSTAQVVAGWPVAALKYSLYNVAIIPVILYCARDIRSTGESICSGVIAGIAGVFPAAVFHVAFMAAYPEILREPLPVYTVLKSLASPIFFWTYIVVLTLMIIATVLGLLHGFNERLDAWNMERTGKPIAPTARALAAIAVMMLSLLLAQFGITALIAEGYGTLAWAYLLVFVAPLLLLTPLVMRRHSSKLRAQRID
jgi:uncharacterized membrane protein YkvI